jgi:hypothetical protein
LDGRNGGVEGQRITAESAALDIERQQGEANRLSRALQVAKCMAENKVDVDLTQQLFDKLNGSGVSISGVGSPVQPGQSQTQTAANVTLTGASDHFGAGRIQFKNLTIAIIDGPGGTKEVLISARLPRTDAERQLEEFVTHLGSCGLAVKETDGRRSFSLGEQRIGLPIRNVLSKGFNFNRNPGGQSVTLTNPSPVQKEILEGSVAAAAAGGDPASSGQDSLTFELDKIGNHVAAIESWHKDFVKEKIAEVADSDPYAKIFSKSLENSEKSNPEDFRDFSPPSSPTFSSPNSLFSPSMSDLTTSYVAAPAKVGSVLDRETAEKLDEIFAPMGAAVDIGARLGRHLRSPHSPFSPQSDLSLSSTSSTSSASSFDAVPGSSVDVFENLKKMRDEILRKLLQLEQWRAEILAAKEKSKSEQEGELGTAKESAEGKKTQGEIDENQRLSEQNTRRLTYNEALARCIEMLSKFRKICEKALEKQLSCSEQACLEVALDAAGKLFTHLRKKNSCLFTKNEDNTSMNITHGVGGIGAGGVTMFGDEQVKGFLSAIGADNERLVKEKSDLELKNKRLEDELRREREENARQADELKKLQKQKEDMLAAIHKDLAEPLPTISVRFNPIEYPPEED